VASTLAGSCFCSRQERAVLRLAFCVFELLLVDVARVFSSALRPAGAAGVM
jgi:hypothetical protein